MAKFIIPGQALDAGDPIVLTNTQAKSCAVFHENGKDEIIEQLEQMANEAGSSQERNAIQQAVRQLRTAK